MTCEDAFYMKMLLISGFSEPYGPWLEQKIIEEEPLSRVTVDLMECGTDINKVIACLNRYCWEQKIDLHAVCERLRFYIKEQYENGKMSKKNCIYALVRFAKNSEQEHESPWWKMMRLSYYYEYTEDSISMEAFDAVFMQYLQDGTLPVPFSESPHPIKKPEHETIIRKSQKRNFFRKLFSKK